MRCSLFVALVMLMSVSVANAESTNLSLKIERFIEVTTQVAEEDTYYEVQNRADTKLESFRIACEEENLANIGVYKVTDKQGNSNEIIESLSALEYKKVGEEDHNDIRYSIFEITLASPLSKNGKALVKVCCSYTHKMSPKPQKMVQTDVQKMVYRGNTFVATLYPTARQITDVRCMQVISFSENELPTAVNSENQIVTFGPYEDVEAFSYSPSYVHLYNTASFLVVDQLIREIEISHWGNIAIEEYYILHNDGTALKGSFSRLDYMMGQIGNSIPQFVQEIPVHAFDVYYRDIIGNISTSHVYRHKDFVKFEVIPRFVLMGGWRDEFKIGYNLPTYSHLTYDSNGYELTIPAINLFESAIVDEAEIRVILPEGASDIEVSSSFIPIDELKFNNRKTYLDTDGRTVVSFTTKNLVDAHNNRDIIVTYQFSTFDMIREPLFLILGYSCLFLLAILYFRSNFSLGTSGESHSNVDSQLINEFLGIVESRNALFNAPPEKNVAKQLAKFNSEINDSFAAAKTVITKISATNPEAASACRAIENASKNQVIAFRSLQSLQKPTSAQAKTKVGELKSQFSKAKDTVHKSIEQLRQ